ncbi:MAG TPA: cation:proton antiporter, partial [Candidatus Baltobacteraceae bacterium]
VAIVEGESIANDGVAVVLTQTLVVCALGGTALGWTYPLLRMLAVSLGGIAVGVGMGFIVAVFLRSALAGGAQVILTLVLGYGSYVIAQALGFSGIFATVAAGLVAAAGGGYRGHEDPRRLYVAHYWDVAALAANVIVFILLGMNLSLEWLSRAPLLCAAAIAATFLARALLAYVLVPLRGLGESTRGWRNAIALAGLRGGLSVALALGLPLVLPGRDAILYATVAVVFTTLVVQGILTPHLVPRLAIADSD